MGGFIPQPDFLNSPTSLLDPNPSPFSISPKPQIQETFTLT